MALKKKPVNGMKDILPREMEIRDYVTGIIKDTYRSYGFTPIETPRMEDIRNLTSNQGGENEKLIFKVLKRGEKLHLEDARTDLDVSDMGLRYDLTLPLSRFYANNENDLPSPFKALQIGNVWRADRPQRGRYRQFTQCDIDILGEPSDLAEIELILATTTCLDRIGFHGFEIRINERRILKAMAEYCGFDEDRFDILFITLDKMDKIGLDGVKEELIDEGFDAAAVDKYLDIFNQLKDKKDVKDGVDTLVSIIGDKLDPEVADSMKEIAESVNECKTADFELVFDPTLVRGMGYYTGTIFEIAIPEFGGSCGGGGRYDHMVGRFAGHEVPACGFSIGFERIIMLLLEHDFQIPQKPKTAFLIDKKLSSDRLSAVIKQANELRSQGQTVLIEKMKKNKKFQKQGLTDSGYTEIKEFYNDTVTD